jgi:hypothetical protein
MERRGASILPSATPASPAIAWTGTCPDAAAQNIDCFDAPASYCNGNELVAYYPHGVAIEDGLVASCIYSQTTISCAQGCENNSCNGDPCAGVTCNNPPPRYCDNDMLVKWEALGRCAGNGKCQYDKQTIACENGCSEGACNGEDSCEFISCVTPPADFCLNDTTLYSYIPRGVCEDGACIYEGREVSCSCRNGRCIDDPCLGVSCVYPPPPQCTEDGKLRIWDGGFFADLCQDGVCVYDFEEMECDQGDCVDGHCPDYCEGRNYYCDISRAPDYCDGDIAVSKSDESACYGSGYCEWVVTTEECMSGCEAGVCQK